MFDRQATRTPDRIAIEFSDEHVSYEELRRRVDRLARYLRRHGIVEGDRVGIALGRTTDLVVALLAVQKAGAAYVPLDPAYPATRIQFLLADAGIRWLVTERSLLPLFGQAAGTRIVLDEERDAIALEDDTPLTSAASSDAVAYVIYTSGSTGAPKGVQVTQRNLVNFLCSMQCEPGMAPSDVIAAITTISFDIAALEIYLPLVVGARSVFVPRDVATDGRALAALLERSGATVLQATPATWRMLLDAGWRGRRQMKALCGGEALPRDLANRLLARCGSLWNMYGPTETTVWSAIHRVTTDKGPVPIGRPIANTRIHVLDASLSEVTEGEIYIGGDGVALGYLNRPELTAERFVPDPFSSRSEGRLYRTGDLARRLADGTIIFLGRVDHQVKVRGYRVEPGEIEQVLTTHPGIRCSVVAAQDDASGEKRLVAYYETDSREPIPAADVRSFASGRLPQYMVPSAFVHVLALPLAPNGKVDRRALPVAVAASGRETVPPRDHVESELVRIWERALETSPVGVTDDFFDLGGHSLLAARVFGEIARRFGRNLPLASLVSAPTIAALAPLVRGEEAASWETLVTIQPRGSGRPLFIVHGGGGTVLFLRDLAHRLGADRPVFGLQSEGLDGRPASRRSVEQMAAHYLSAIRPVQPRGPYLLAGYCFGGIVAFEMAQQLWRDGDRAALVALLNAPNRAVPAYAIEADLQPPVERRVALARHRSALRRLPLAAKAHYAGSALAVALAWRRAAMRDWRITTRLAFRQWLADAYADAGLTVPQRLRDAFVLRLTTEAEAAYVPQPYAGHLVIFRGKGLYKDPTLGWRGLAAGIDAIEVGGPQRLRRDLVREPVVEHLANELRRYLPADDKDGKGFAA